MAFIFKMIHFYFLGASNSSSSASSCFSFISSASSASQSNLGNHLAANASTTTASTQDKHNESQLSTSETSNTIAKQIVDAINKAGLLNQASHNPTLKTSSAFKPPSNHYTNAHSSNMMPPSTSASSNNGDSSNNKHGNKHKNKPLPLIIPSDISSFAIQQQQQQQQNLLNYQYGQLNGASQHSIPYYHQMSANAATYPHATLLKSPRLALQSDLKKQYTPPPMLSPFRKGPGLYYKYFANMFLLPNAAAAAAAAAASLTNSSSQYGQQLLQQSMLNAVNRPPMFNHSMSCSYLYPQSNFYNFKAADLNKENESASGVLTHEEDTEEAHLDEASEGNFKENIDYEKQRTTTSSHVDAIKVKGVLEKEDEISMNNLKEQVLTNNSNTHNNSNHADSIKTKRPRLSNFYRDFLSFFMW